MASTTAGMAATTEPHRASATTKAIKKQHIADEPLTRHNWYKHVNWLNITLIVGVPIYGMMAAYWTPLQWKTGVFAFVYYFLTGLGITGGLLHHLLHKGPTANIHCRIPQTLGTQCLLCPPSSQDLPRSCWSWCRPRFNQMVVKGPPCPPQIHRHRQGPILRTKGSPILSLRLDAVEAEPEANWTYRYLRSQR